MRGKKSISALNTSSAASATGGELARRIFRPAGERLSEVDIKFVFFQLALALKYLHDRGITHRDLKPENVLIASNESLRVMITDFGLSRMTSQASMMNTVCGTPLYLAPEILTNSDGGGGYDRAVDCWSMGVMLYVMLSGQPPFQDESRDALFSKIVHGMYNFSQPAWAHVSPLATDLIRKLLVLEPAKRYNVDQMLAHPWLQDAALLQRYDGLQNALPDSYHMDDIVPTALRTGLTMLIDSAQLQSGLMDAERTASPAASSLMQVDAAPAAPDAPVMDGLFKMPMPPKRAPPLPPQPPLLHTQPQPMHKVMSLDPPQPSASDADASSLPTPEAVKRKRSDSDDTANKRTPTAISTASSSSGSTSTSATSTPTDASPLTTPPPTTSTPPLPPQQQRPGAVTTAQSFASSSASWPVGTWLHLKSLVSSVYPHVNVTTDSVVFGRNDTCHHALRYTQPRISSVHCIIRQRPDGQVELQDLSTNGTYVNDTLVGKGNTVLLRHMDEIVVLRGDRPTDVLVGYIAMMRKRAA